MFKKFVAEELDTLQSFFNRSSDCLTEADSKFAPTPEMMTVCQQVLHAAETIVWFVNGATDPKGFDLDFEKQAKIIQSCSSLSQARNRFAAAIDLAKATFSEMSEQELQSPLPAGPIMGGRPKWTVITGLMEHTAHHRGALTVYSRLLGRVPKMPYA